MAAALSLSGSEATRLFKSVGYPPVTELMIDATDKERELLLPWAKPILARFGQAFDLIEERRRQAEDWKQLHQDCQAVSLKLVIARGLALLGSAEIALQSFETYWLNECLRRMKRLIELERLPDRAVKQDFMSVDQSNEWTQELQKKATEMNSILKQCVTARAFQVHRKAVGDVLHSLETTNGQVLEFLDGRLQIILRELDSDIGEARTNFTQAKIFLE